MVCSPAASTSAIARASATDLASLSNFGLRVNVVVVDGLVGQRLSCFSV